VPCTTHCATRQRFADTFCIQRVFQHASANPESLPDTLCDKGEIRVCQREFCRRVLRALRDILTELEFQGVFQPIYTLELLLDLELRLRYFIRFLLRRYYRLLLLVDYCRLLLPLVCKCCMQVSGMGIKVLLQTPNRLGGYTYSSD
jgi:hypothetical protein